MNKQKRENLLLGAEVAISLSLIDSDPDNLNAENSASGHVVVFNMMDIISELRLLVASYSHSGCSGNNTWPQLS